MTNELRDDSSSAAPDEQKSVSISEALSIAVGYHQRGVLNAAEELYLQILAQKPDLPEVLNFLGVLRFQLGSANEGIQLILAALKINPSYIDALNNLGNILRKQNELEDAEKVYRRAIEIEPQFYEAHMNLAALYYTCDRYEEALASARFVEQHSPEVFEANATAARTIEADSMASTGDFAGAAKSYLRAIERNTFKSSVHKNLARVLWRLNRRDEAIQAYQRWIEMEPDNPEPRHHLAACTGIDVPARAPDNYVKEVFDRFAESFDSQLTKLRYAAPSLVVEAIREQYGAPESKLTILDAGCGTGLCGVLIRSFAEELVGVDLSPNMLDKARAREVYDELHAAELTAFLANAPASYDAIVSADTLVYFGDLKDVMQAASVALRPDGRLIFTVERMDSTDATAGYSLQNHGRYQHSDQYVRSMAEQAGLELVLIREVSIRLEGGNPVAGSLAVAKRR